MVHRKYIFTGEEPSVFYLCISLFPDLPSSSLSSSVKFEHQRKKKSCSFLFLHWK